ncbi:MAG: hypothetical protein ABFR62_11920 [Bacteroidota bacterium]
MNTQIKILHWSPRILCILAILFISMFALDAYEPDLPFWKQLGAFAMHLIPSFVLTLILLIAWKWELIGGILFAVIGLALSPWVFKHNYNMNHSYWMSLGIIMMITVPFVIVGVLFIMSYLKKRNNKLKS